MPLTGAWRYRSPPPDNPPDSTKTTLFAAAFAGMGLVSSVHAAAGAALVAQAGQPPVLSSFTALSTDVDSSQPGAQLGYSYTGADDYSGASAIWVALRTDDYAGWTYLQIDVGYPDTSLKGKFAVDAQGLKSGHWLVD